jgi:hypothetical protein
MLLRPDSWEGDKIAHNQREQYVFNPVTDRKKYEDGALGANPEEVSGNGYKACILWYAETFDDQDYALPNRNMYKPIFKGVISNDTFTRIAYTQESVDINITHWIQLLDVVMMRNLLLSTQSANAVSTPWLRNYDPQLKTQSGKSKPISVSTEAVRTAAIDSADESIKLNDALLTYVHHQAGLMFKYKPMLDSMDSKFDVDKIIKANIALVQTIIEFLQDGRGKAMNYITNPTLTKERCGGNTCPKDAFMNTAAELEFGGTNGLTFYQCLVKLASEFRLHMVCTANLVSFEAIKYRVVNWAKDIGLITSSTCISSGRSFTRNMAISVGAANMSPQYGTDNDAALRLGNQDPSGASVVQWADAYVDPTATDGKRTLGSLVLFNLPRWFSCSTNAQDNQNKVSPRRVTVAVEQSGSGADNPNAEQDPATDVDSSDKNKYLTRLIKSMHYQTKLQGRLINVVMPMNMNVMVGMPVCIQDSLPGKNTRYHTGIVTSFTHTLMQTDCTAHTSISVSWPESFISDAAPASAKLVNIESSDDVNPIYDEAFEKRPIYK